ncbi:C-C motif chemokine 22-like isoform X2 [Lampris incognitus]|uniref:C-C motif chemokine 22-like isoform X2 n=1 Tax=Lampris incognitus TaxID=2546036 RepID=UPI0024B4C46F|nr:C-C motif chemokine 22-like isoform X2 [Lampris incognitus]
MKMMLVPILLLCCVCLPTQGSWGTINVSEKGCCQSFRSTPIPWALVKDVTPTPNDCPHTALVVRTVARRFCVDPKLRWVERLMRKFTTTTTTTSSLPADADNRQSLTAEDVVSKTKGVCGHNDRSLSSH